MKSSIQQFRILLVVVPLTTTAAWAVEVNPQLSINLTVAGAVQHQSVSNGPSADGATEGALPAQPEMSYRPWASGEFYAKLGFAAGNGLNPESPFHLAPWGADLQDDVKDINGRGRDYLLAAHYRHTFAFSSGDTVSLSAGILDSTDFLDHNEYANDEYTQFMNETFVNSGSYGLPSYDWGIAAEWERGAWTVHALAMQIGENDDGNTFTFAGLQVGYLVENDWGTGVVRAILAGTDHQFHGLGEERPVSRLAWGISVDQEMGENLGGFLRIGWQTQDSEVLFRSVASGGVEIKGRLFGRDRDRIGLGLAYLDGGNSIAESTVAVEGYYAFAVNDWFIASLDIQYMRDRNREGPSPRGWILGIRTTAQF
jgi:porin